MLVLSPKGCTLGRIRVPAPVAFETAEYSGELAPAGIRFHDFESDGHGHGIELDVSVNGGAARVVIARVR